MIKYSTWKSAQKTQKDKVYGVQCCHSAKYEVAEHIALGLFWDLVDDDQIAMDYNNEKIVVVF